MSSDRCTVATITAGLEFRRTNERLFGVHKPQEYNYSEMVFDFNIVELMRKLNLSSEQQDQAKRRILQASMEICLEISKDAQTGN